jgi:erythritol kinase (D-erythritol 1-phosphate-forming)
LGRQTAKLVYHPYISLAGERGPFMEPSARAMLTGLDVTTDYYDMMRGVFEGLGFAARDCYAAMGPVPCEIRITGGAARSQALRVILASVLDAKVRSVTREEAGAAGAAMMAAVQQEIYPDMAACADHWVNPHLGEVTEPDRGLVLAYNAAFKTYVDTRIVMRPIWRQRTAQ